VDGKPDHIIISDIHDAEPMNDMSYPQRIAAIALDLKPMLFYAGRYDRLFSRYGFDVMGQAMRYFDRVADAQVLQDLARFAHQRPDGLMPIDDLYRMSVEKRRPLIEYKDNPLVKALVQQYSD
jgi:hypothetical protein